MSATHRCPGLISVLCATLGSLAGLLAATQPAHASDPSSFLSEIITPAGWEIRTPAKRCGADAELAGGGELVIPDGWREPRVSAGPSWTGSCMCSELVVPEAWAHAVQQPTR